MKLQRISKIFFVLSFTFLLCNSAFASESVGTIDEGFYLTKLCQNSDCSQFQNVNFRPTNGSEVVITDSGLSGDIWFETSGWVSLDPINGGVSNTTGGTLSGHGWGQIASWVNFNPSNGGVTINENGEFSGWAWVSGGYGGWVKFDCSDVSTCIKTDWRPLSSRSVQEVGSSPGSGQVASASVGNGGPGASVPTLSTTTGQSTNINDATLQISNNNISEDTSSLLDKIATSINQIKDNLKAEIGNFNEQNKTITDTKEISGISGENSEIQNVPSINDLDKKYQDVPQEHNTNSNGNVIVYFLTLVILSVLVYRVRVKRREP